LAYIHENIQAAAAAQQVDMDPVVTRPSISHVLVGLGKSGGVNLRYDGVWILYLIFGKAICEGVGRVADEERGFLWRRLKWSWKEVSASQLGF
jgi:hypothetical protein